MQIDLHSLFVILLSLMPFSVPSIAMMSPAFAAPSGVHAASSVSIGTLTFTGVFPRIFTPNSDGYNDKAVFHFDNPEQLPVTGKIYDISGSEVASLPAGTDTVLWDGKSSDGHTVPGGVYLYSLEYQGKNITGTIIVAR
jgi:gliding motility-associated-like protein